MSELFYCSDCRCLIKPEDVEEEECYLAEAWGRPVYETYNKCPHCGETVGLWINEVYLYDENGEPAQTCQDCALFGTEECPYGEEGKEGNICADFEEG